MISPQNLLFDFLAVRGTAGVFSATPPALAAPQTLLAVGRFAVANDFLTAAMAARHADLHHETQLNSITLN